MKIKNTADMLQAFDKVYADMRTIISKKSSDYGVECWQILGKRGVFADMNRKYWRLKNLVWDEKGASVTDEKLYDTALDMANNCIMLAILLKSKRR